MSVWKFIKRSKNDLFAACLMTQSWTHSCHSRQHANTANVMWYHGNRNTQSVLQRGFNDHQKQVCVIEHLPSCFPEMFFQQLRSSWSDNIAFWQMVLSYTGSGCGHITGGTNPGYSTSYRMEPVSGIASCCNEHFCPYILPYCKVCPEYSGIITGLMLQQGCILIC